MAGNVPLPLQTPFKGTDPFRRLNISSKDCRGKEATTLVFFEFQLPDFSQLLFQQVLESLERRFGDRRKTSFYLTRVEARRLGRTESIAKYVTDIRTLANKRYPMADRIRIEVICIRGLGDQQLSITVGMREPTTLEEARDILEMYQGNEGGGGEPCSWNKNKAESAVTEERLKEFGEQLSNTLTKKVVTHLGHAMHFGGSRGGYRGRGRKMIWTKTSKSHLLLQLWINGSLCAGL